MKKLDPVSGFRFAGIASGIKKDGSLDLGLIVADQPVPTAVVTTKNRVRAACVELIKKRARSGRAQAILVNSGCANACTGERGRRDALSTTQAVADTLEIDRALVFSASTGVIGQPLPRGVIEKSAGALVAAAREKSAGRFARAILTTDKGTKVSRIAFRQGGHERVILGIAKGAGMIHPDMATTLAFVVTDAAIPSDALSAALGRATDKTFNCISVDGDTSTNDTIVVMASGDPTEGETGAASFETALTEVLDDLATMIVADGEGAEHVAKIVVTGCKDSDARKVARTVGTSMLVKTAMNGKDPNWGRIVAAVGRAGVKVNPNKITVSIGDVVVYTDGMPVSTAKAENGASRAMKKRSYEIKVALGGPGNGEGYYLTCDLGSSYVKVNSTART